MIKRKIEVEIASHLKEKEISLLTGPRQVGKTTIMETLRRKLNNLGEKTVFLSLDWEQDRSFFQSQSALLQKVKLEIGPTGYVFIDEIQRKENAGLFLKGLWDMDLPYKLIVSGSGSLELKEKIHESLMGRKRLFEISPISFEEFSHYKTEYRYEKNLHSFFSLHPDKTLELLNEYLNFGGYPRVIVEAQLIEKIKIIDEIYKSYLEKDISYLLKVEKTDSFISLIRILSSQIGCLMNILEISNTIDLSQITVKKYMQYAQKTFLIEKISPYFKNLRKEITKAPMIYFIDLGFRNYARGVFGQILNQEEYGFLFQNFIFQILKEKLRYQGATLHFWRSKDGAEVDFIINQGHKILPLEVKYQNFKKPILSQSSKNFIKKYQPRSFYIITKNFKHQLSLESTKIVFLPFWELMTLDLTP